MNAAAKMVKREVDAALQRAGAAAAIGDVSNGDLLAWFRESTMGQRFAGEALAAQLKARADLVDQRERAKSRAESERQQLVSDLQARMRTEDEARKAYEAAKMASSQAQVALQNHALGLEARVATINAVLEASADRRIEAFVQRMLAEHDAARGAGGQFAPDPSTKITAHVQKGKYMDGLLTAVKSAELLKLEALSPDSVVAKLDEIEHGIPYRAA
jgi:hypothetical protein